MKLNQKINEIKNKPDNKQTSDIMRELTSIEQKMRELVLMMRVTNIRDFHTMSYEIDELINMDFSKYHKRSLNEFMKRSEPNKKELSQ